MINARQLGFSLSVALALTACTPREAEEAVRHEMVDPASTQFRDVRQCDGDRTITYGEYNTKNSMGGFAGFKRFFYADNVAVFITDADYGRVQARCYGIPYEAPAVAASKAAAEAASGAADALNEGQ